MRFRSATLLFSLLLLFVSACSDDQDPSSDAAGGDIALDLVSDWDNDDSVAELDQATDPVLDQLADMGLDPGADDLPLEPEVVLPPDRDGDGVPDDDDIFPDDPCEATDLDEDGIGDASDPDRDGDGVDNRWEWRVGTDPDDPLDFPDETDSDDDGLPDYRDPFPLDPTRSQDLDGDGLDDDEDPDDDNDEISDEQEILDDTDPRGVVPPDRCALGHLAGWVPGDFHSHTNYSDDAAQMGGDDIDVWVDLHEYYEDPRFLAVHPEYEGRALRFQAISDHSTLQGAFDPDFHSDRLVLIPGDEISGVPQHANALNIFTHVSNRPPQTTTYSERYAAGARQTRYQGGLFSINHPCQPGHLWVTPVDLADSFEVWNSVWGMVKASTEEELDAAVASRGPENPYIRPAIRRITNGANNQSLALWENMLAGGVHLAPVGGSDRHILLAPAHPTTWVYAPRLTREGVMTGVRNRHTVITRHPGAIRQEAYLSIGDDGLPAMVGERLSVAPGDPVTVSVSLEHAAGATIQVVGGPLLPDPTPEDLMEFPGGTVLLSHQVPSDAQDPYEWTDEITLEIPGWVYLRVLEPISLEGLSPTSQEMLQSAIEKIKVGLADYHDLADILLPWLPISEVLGSIPCSEENWTAREELNAECFLVDQELFYTFLLPEQLDLILNLWTGPGPDGDHALGALTSAWVITGEE
ncbi:MAG: thrombospondin type 3 repeat-containing protein [Bradymonadales bacterium]|nr:thrombospondin type 3 repeat-containing protein [Bradymonadales bacterium]